MAHNVSAAARATQGNDVERRFHTDHELERRGNSLSRRCLIEAIDAYVGVTQVPRKVLAQECGQSEQQFSKSLSGIKGGDFNEVLDNIRRDIRLDYARRMTDAEVPGGLQELAAEALAYAAIRYLSTMRKRMAKV
jgi:hypothetical protein